MTKILVIGIAGRMGKTIAACIEDTDGVELGGGTEQGGSLNLGKDIGEVAGIGIKGVTVSDNLTTALENCNVGLILADISKKFKSKPFIGQKILDLPSAFC